MKNRDRQDSDSLKGSSPESVNESRLIELEIKVTRQDDLLDQLNTVIFDQQKQIDVLAKKIATFEKQVDAPSTPRNDKPPHY